MDKPYRAASGQIYGAKSVESDHDGRRAFLKGAVALAGGLASVVAGPRYSPVHAQGAEPSDTNPVMINYLAHRLRAEVPRKDIFKYGWKVQILQADDCGFRYIISCQNEPYVKPGKYSRANKTRVLTTFLEITPWGDAQWARYDPKSHLVGSSSDVNAMTLHLEGKSIPNLRRFNNTVQHFDPLEIKVSLDHLVDQISKEQMQMHRWLRGESDPWSITTIRPTGIAENGKMNYEIVVRKVEGDARAVHRVEETSQRVVLAANLNFDKDGISRLTRSDGTDLSAPDSKVYAWIPDASGLEIKKYGVDNRGTASSDIWTPELAALTGPYWT
ncbi:hypothetical protein HYV80_07305 [Candidatus Woesearchaeota archaeon]|nr:hypothetical protein [Candidatus Woesearchaeota archaeon]